MHQLTSGFKCSVCYSLSNLKKKKYLSAITLSLLDQKRPQKTVTITKLICKGFFIYYPPETIFGVNYESEVYVSNNGNAERLRETDYLLKSFSKTKYH